MNKELFDDALKSYLDGTASPENKALINRWYAQYEKGEGFVGKLTDDQKELLRQKMLEKILFGIVEPDKQLPGKVSKFPTVAAWMKYSAVAAAVVLAFGLYFWFRPNNDKAKMNWIANNTTHIIKQILSDKSVVWLSPGATLNYPAVFEDQSRNVSMSGDCFFEVTKNPRRPFVIVSNQLVTKVWGTSFRVYDVNNAPEARVTVLSGKVSVLKKEDSNVNEYTHIAKNELILLPKQEAVCRGNAPVLEARQQADMKPLQKWSHASMKFDNAAFSDIVVDLTNSFGIDIRFDINEFRNTRMTADLSGLNLPEVLDVLKASLQIKYDIYENYVTIYR